MIDADVLFQRTRVFSAGMTTSEPRDIAVAAGRIVAIGDDLRELAGAATEIVDGAGGLLVPGFQDAHVHPVVAGVELLRCDLSQAQDAEDCLRLVAEYAASHPEDEWILGGGWSMEFFAGGVPRAEVLDAIVPDRPVLLTNRDHHGAWANSRALELAGIDALTPDPADGRIERDLNGSPSGTLHEGAMDLVERLVPAVDPDFALRALLIAQQRLFSHGITGWQDAMVGAVSGLPDTAETYLRAAREGSLVARVVGAQWWARDATGDQLAGIVARRDRAAALGMPERLRLDTVKIMVDGIAENHTAAMSSPYRDSHGHATDNSGLSFFDPAELQSIVTRLDAEGLQVHFHALGDRAVSEALDALAAARSANGVRDSRHHLAHLQVVASRDVARFAELGAAANLQALWACHEPQLDQLTIPFLEPELVSRHYPFGDLQRAGAALVCGSDWPVTTPDPLAAIHVAVNRTSPGSDRPPLGDDQAIDLATALSAYTAGSAWVNRRESDTGMLAVGARADLALLDRDPFLGAADEIADARVAGTWVDGIRVHELVTA